MSFLGKKILNLRSRPKKTKRANLEQLSFETSTSFGLFYTWENRAKMESIEALSEALQAEGKTVSCLCFNPLKEDIAPIHPTFGIESLSSFGKFKSEIVEQFMHQSFDYLLLLDFNLSEISTYLCAHAQALCKVGIHQEQTEDYFDLMVQVNANAGIDQFIEQVVKYIKIIKHE